MDILENATIKDWLAECRTESTRRNYELRIQKFFEHYEAGVEAFLSLPIKEKAQRDLKVSEHVFREKP